MRNKHLRKFLPILFLAAGVVVIGCSSSALKKLVPRPAPKTDVVPGLIPPHEQMSALRRQREQAEDLPPEEAAELASKLATRCADEEDPLIRVEIVKTLGALRTDTARSTLRAALQDSSSDVRVAACEAWRRIGDQEAVEQLTLVLSSDTDKTVRFAAVKALGPLGSPQAVQALGTALEDRDPAMQYLAMESLRESTGEDFGNDARMWRQYVRGEIPTEEETSIASKFFDLF